MKTLPYLDIHTHRRQETADAVSVECLSLEELCLEKPPRAYASAGVHPWWLEDYTEEEITKVQGHIRHLVETGKVWAIGETGLDRMSPEFLEKQNELFDWHLDLAEKHQLPLVIHSVRSGSDFLQKIKEKKPTTPWIFHDFRGNEQLLRDLLRLHPKCFFSFGLSIDNSPQIRELLPLVPLESLFLETDDQKHLDIHDIYLRASENLKLDLEFLKAQVWLNFKKISRILE